jgi:hypothetical protein
MGKPTPRCKLAVVKALIGAGKVRITRPLSQTWCDRLGGLNFWRLGIIADLDTFYFQACVSRLL